VHRASQAVEEKPGKEMEERRKKKERPHLLRSVEDDCLLFSRRTASVAYPCQLQFFCRVCGCHQPQIFIE
jgi:hypothetical protein